MGQSHLEQLGLKIILENSTLSRYVKKLKLMNFKQKKKMFQIDRPTQFSDFGRVRAMS